MNTEYSNNIQIFGINLRLRQQGTHQADCDNKVPIKLKDKVYNMVIKPTLTFGAECWAVRKKDEKRLHIAEMRMLRWLRGKTRKDHVRNQLTQEDDKVCQMSTFLRQKRLH